ncbi:MAG: lipase family protein [Candidatus Competibacteraceae bacterium]|nr:lipase family protein [Candidatus Competibacteraceae bacterium]
MSTLNPQQAAAIATGVYRLMNRSVSELQARGGELGCEDMFAIDDSSRFTGKSGGLIAWKEITGFGYIASGTGKYQGEVLLATRGTQSKPDWLSNLNIGLQLGPGGCPVHAGFNEVWKSFAPDIMAFLRNRNPTLIHCVGHSLGGALANLGADCLSAAQAGAIKLYTFGAPRTGIGLFAESLSSRVGVDNMFRVYHTSDPVPMIPVFPFQHAPVGKQGLSVKNGNRGLISIDAHLMPSYTSAVASLSWSGLEAASREAELSPGKIESWLNSAAAGGNPVIVGSAFVLKMIGKAIYWILSKVGALVVGTVGLVLTATATLLDHLACMLRRAAQFSKEVAGHVENLVVVIFKFLGRPLVKGMSLTLVFIGFVLDLLFQRLRNTALGAVALVGR